MEDRPEAGPGLTVRDGGREDSLFVVALGAVAFARFGEYAPVMREFLASRQVVSFIGERDGRPLGFALVDRVPESPGVADLVAIAVDSRHRRSGVGRALLERVIRACEQRRDTSLVVLTVAEDNDAAVQLFRSMGFTFVPGLLGRYAGGQPSRRMARPV